MLGRSRKSTVPRFEISATVPFFMRSGNTSCVGGGGTGGFRVAPSWQWTVEVGGCSIAGSLPRNWSGDSLTFSMGPQWIRHSTSRWTPYLHFRIGGQKVTQEYTNPTLKQQILSALPPTKSASTVYWDYTTLYETTGPSLSIGGGVDLQTEPGRGSAVRKCGLRSLLVEQTQWDRFNTRHPGEHGTRVTNRDLVKAVVTSIFYFMFSRTCSNI